MPAIYPGSFDPITLGHLDLIERGSRLFDRVIVAVLRNPNKTPLFTVAERIEQIRRSTTHLTNVEVDSFDGLTVTYAKMRKATALLRGLRVVSDFEMELQMAHTNKTLSEEIETVFLATSNEHSFLSSSLVKEIAKFGGLSIILFHNLSPRISTDVTPRSIQYRSDPGFNPNLGAPQNGVPPRESARAGLDIQRELNRLEEMILDSPRFPIWGRTMIDEEKVIEQLDLIRLSLPEAFHEAETLVRHKEEIFMQAEQYAQEIIDTAERRAAQMMNETGIVRQAEMQAQQIRQRVQQECESIREQTIAEIDRMRRQAQQELEDMQRMAIAECEEIQAGADHYADQTLQEMEMQLAEMLRVIRNGRQQIQADAVVPRSSGAGMRPQQRM